LRDHVRLAIGDLHQHDVETVPFSLVGESVAAVGCCVVGLAQCVSDGFWLCLSCALHRVEQDVHRVVAGRSVLAGLLLVGLGILLDEGPVALVVQARRIGHCGIDALGRIAREADEVGSCPGADSEDLGLQSELLELLDQDGPVLRLGGHEHPVSLAGAQLGQQGVEVGGAMVEVLLHHRFHAQGFEVLREVLHATAAPVIVDADVRHRLELQLVRQDLAEGLGHQAIRLG